MAYCESSAAPQSRHWPPGEGSAQPLSTIARHVASWRWRSLLRAGPTASAASAASAAPHAEISASEVTIVRLIGQGGQAAVYSGRWVGVPVAVKVPRHLRKNHALRKEASFLSRLRHPSVCALYGHTLMPDGSSALLLELLPSTLTALLEQPQPLPACLAGRIASEVAAGIAFLHRNNVMHRDIKPSNVLLDGTAHAKVADFGIAALIDKTSSRASPSSSASTAAAPSASPPSSGHTAGIGTRYFMAPEVRSSSSLVQRSAYNEQCDVYSYGMLLWSLMHQRRRA